MLNWTSMLYIAMRATTLAVDQRCKKNALASLCLTIKTPLVIAWRFLHSSTFFLFLIFRWHSDLIVVGIMLSVVAHSLIWLCRLLDSWPSQRNGDHLVLFLFWCSSARAAFLTAKGVLSSWTYVFPFWYNWTTRAHLHVMRSNPVRELFDCSKDHNWQVAQSQ